MTGSQAKCLTVRIGCVRIRVQVRQLLSIWIACLCLVQGQALGPAYRVSNRFCTSHQECNVHNGEVCKWLFGGCERGQCMCNPQTHSVDRTSGICKPQRLGGESCTTSDLCISEDMQCTQGKCQCVSGRMTDDGTFCLKSGQRLLGEGCHRSRDTCLQKASWGYAKQDMQCSHSGVCRCTEGFKEDGIRCSKWKIGDSGCSQNHHCMGGALCLTGMCRCPNSYDAVAGNTKCAKRGAVINLPLSETCDEFNERRYCGSGLICSRCAAGTPQKCIKYLISDEKTYINSSPGLLSTASLLSVALTVIQLVTS